MLLVSPIYRLYILTKDVLAMSKLIKIYSFAILGDIDLRKLKQRVRKSGTRGQLHKLICTLRQLFKPYAQF